MAFNMLLQTLWHKKEDKSSLLITKKPIKFDGFFYELELVNLFLA